jgi:hypothetical protein
VGNLTSEGQSKIDRENFGGHLRSNSLTGQNPEDSFQRLYSKELDLDEGKYFNDLHRTS